MTCTNFLFLALHWLDHIIPTITTIAILRFDSIHHSLPVYIHASERGVSDTGMALGCMHEFRNNKSEILVTTSFLACMQCLT